MIEDYIVYAEWQNALERTFDDLTFQQEKYKLSKLIRDQSKITTIDEIYDRELRDRWDWIG